MTLSAALATPIRLAAQDQADKPKHHHYKLIDIGTVGGPNSSVNEIARVISRHETVVGGADTSTHDL